MKTNVWSRNLAGSALLTFTLCSPAFAALLVNGDFETGNFGGWTLFTLPGSDLGYPEYPGDPGNPVFPRPPKAATPAVLSFDTRGNGTPSLSAAFDVGLIPFQANAGGGGIFQSFGSGAGTLDFSLDIASWAPLFTNGSGGLFRLLLDGTEIARHDFGEIAGGSVERAEILANAAVSAGTHELRVEITREGTNSLDTPQEYVDNVVATLRGINAVPEPSSLALLGLGLTGLGFMHRRRVA